MNLRGCPPRSAPGPPLPLPQSVAHRVRDLGIYLGRGDRGGEGFSSGGGRGRGGEGFASGGGAGPPPRGAGAVRGLPSLLPGLLSSRSMTLISPFTPLLTPHALLTRKNREAQHFPGPLKKNGKVSSPCPRLVSRVALFRGVSLPKRLEIGGGAGAV